LEVRLRLILSNGTSEMRTSKLVVIR
jgi:hypothetical protein